MSEPYTPVCDGCSRNKSECSCDRDKRDALQDRLAKAEAECARWQGEVAALREQLALRGEASTNRVKIAVERAEKAEAERDQYAKVAEVAREQMGVVNGRYDVAAAEVSRLKDVLRLFEWSGSICKNGINVLSCCPCDAHLATGNWCEEYYRGDQKPSVPQAPVVPD